MKTLRETILKHSWQEDMVGPDLVRVDDAIDTLRQWLADQGLAIVPKKATGAMFSAALQRDDHGDLYHGIYTAMIAASPDFFKED